jgi:dihydroorotate dehydrogenase (NAD+) catalytic subunit
MQSPFYDPEKSYEDNFEDGPFGSFADGQVFEHDGKPQTVFLGQEVFLPFGISAGPLINGRFVKAAFDKGFDLAVYKTVRTHEHPCAPWPNILAVKVDGDLKPEIAKKGLVADQNYYQPLAIANSFGVPSADPDFWQEDMADAVHYAKQGQVVIGSFQGTTNADGNIDAYIEDFATAARLVREAGAKILEANLSCPNQGTAYPLCFDLKRTQKVIEAIKDEIGDTPLIIKIAYFNEQNELVNLATTLNPLIQGIAAINRMPSKVIFAKGTPGFAGTRGMMSGICGAPIKWAGLEMTERLKRLRDRTGSDYTIIGVGGVTTPDDYNQYRAFGADAIMSATGAMWNPLLAQECLSCADTSG